MAEQLGVMPGMKADGPGWEVSDIPAMQDDRAHWRAVLWHAVAGERGVPLPQRVLHPDAQGCPPLVPPTPLSGAWPSAGGPAALHDCSNVRSCEIAGRLKTRSRSAPAQRDCAGAGADAGGGVYSGLSAVHREVHPRYLRQPHGGQRRRRCRVLWCVPGSMPRQRQQGTLHSGWGPVGDAFTSKTHSTVFRLPGDKCMILQARYLRVVGAEIPANASEAPHSAALPPEK